jgi:Protein of unknown function (DUF2911)
MRQFGVIVATVALCGMTIHAQKTTQVHPGKGGSPHVKSEWTIDGAKIVIEYGRPSVKGRPEATLMPPDQPWRTGADEATIITSDKKLTFGKVTLEPNTPYTINTQPGAQWQLIFGKLSKPDQWGIPYNSGLELGRTPMTSGKAKQPVEQLTITVDDTPKGGALRIEWGTTSVTAPFTVQ